MRSISTNGYVLATIVMIVILGFAGGWWGEVVQELHPQAKTGVSPSATTPPSLVIHQSKLMGWQDNKRTWEIEASKIGQTGDKNRIYFEKIRRGVIFSVEDKRVDFTAGWADWDQIRNQLTIGAGIEATTDQGRFETAEAVVDYRTQRLSCPHSVIYTEKDMVLIAQTMQLDMNQEEYILEGDVQLGHERDSLQAGKVIYNAKTQQYRLEQPGVITLYP